MQEQCRDLGFFFLFLLIHVRCMHGRGFMERRRRNSFDEIDLRNDGGKRMGTVSGNRNCLFIYGKLFDINRG